MIKDWFVNYFLYNADITVDLSSNSVAIHSPHSEPWKVTLVDTGVNSGTSERLAAVRKYVGDEDFMLTYGDGVSNVNIAALVKFHEAHGKIATVTAVRPIGRFGIMQVNDQDNLIHQFVEKGEDKHDWINGGFFVLKPEVFTYVEGLKSMWEREPLEKLAADRELVAFHHEGFWKPMDMLRDKTELEEMWQKGTAPWKLWQD